jgi:uncharacterized protein
MSKFSEYTSKSEANYNKHKDEQVINFMDGISYKTNPLLELEMVAASSIFGEKSYYMDDGVKDKKLNSTTQMFIKACDNALSYDFKGVLELAKKLRYEYNMRLNPALIMVRAVMHEDRTAFNEENKGFMKECIEEILNIPTDIWNQFELWMFFNGSKSKLPSILKRAWADILNKTKKYQLAKYKTKAKIIDLVRICHAHSNDIDELMKNGTIEVSDEESTWEKLRSEGKTWTEILQSTYVPHMALLRNLNGIFKEVQDSNVKNQVLKLLEDGVEKGKQFPYRYYTAIKNLSNINFKPDVEASLNRCLDKAMVNFPKLKGKTICLSDNSGSAWGAFTSEYGSVKIAEIDNLSSVMTAINSDEGYVGIFGDRLEIESVNKRDGVLSQLDKIQSKHSHNIGGGTENGIWLFFDEAIKKKIHYDNIFIYSDQQAGHGGLYGINSTDYLDYITRGSYIDVLKLIQVYRQRVNPKVNVFSVQTAGYNNNVVPENEYRTSILTGWTGKESVYANALIDIWNKMENQVDEVKTESSIKIKTSAKKN